MEHFGVWHAISSAHIVVQFTLLLLIGMSLVSWAIIVQKRKQFRLVAEANKPFEEKFWKASALDDIQHDLKHHPNSNLANVFHDGYTELKKIADSPLNKKHGGSSPMLSGIDNLERSLSKSIDSQVAALESRLNFLATVGNIGPFVGLFGTVWGIMTAFQKIGATGMASLGVVAPGISEALIATAVGLLAAIPASAGYNYYLTELKKFEVQLKNFSFDFLNIAKRNFFKED